MEGFIELAVEYPLYNDKTIIINRRRVYSFFSKFKAFMDKLASTATANKLK